MDKNCGILICPHTHTVSDVHAFIWSGCELRQKLQIDGNEEIVLRDWERTGDTIVVSGFLNVATAGKASRCEGFDLCGERFYGRALVISGDENRSYPVMDPHDISRKIRFLRLDRPNDASIGSTDSLHVNY
jgi:hypothetical protein